MSHPQHLRAYLHDGPRAGETVSIAPADDGTVPDAIVLDDTGSLEIISGSPERSGDAATTTYVLAEPDMDNSLWVYRAASSRAADDGMESHAAEAGAPAQPGEVEDSLNEDRWKSQDGSPG